jgi:glycosyltransferase involved in cell wall biosynthesis
MGPTDEVPEYYEECLSLLRNLGTEDVHITGKINVKEYLGWMDIVVLTSISEGQPLALMEAMAAGKPCVATNVGSCKELLEGRNGDCIGPAGLIAPVMNHQRLTEQILISLRDPQLRQRMGEAARLRIETFYSEEQFVRNYETLYKEFELIYSPNCSSVQPERKQGGPHPPPDPGTKPSEQNEEQNIPINARRRRLFRHEKKGT